MVRALAIESGCEWVTTDRDYARFTGLRWRTSFRGCWCVAIPNHFILTGSSARKIRDGGVNLSVGRAQTRYLHPFTYRELGAPFVLVRASQRGGDLLGLLL